jgi:hypothetical protein
VGGRH